MFREGEGWVFPEISEIGNEEIKMSDKVQVKLDVEIALLDEQQSKTIYAATIPDVTITVPVDNYTWDRMGCDDREEVIQGILWERCRVYCTEK